MTHNIILVFILSVLPYHLFIFITQPITIVVISSLLLFRCVQPAERGTPVPVGPLRVSMNNGGDKVWREGSGMDVDEQDVCEEHVTCRGRV